MFVFSNLAMSVDGKIATFDRSFFPLGTAGDLREMQRLRKKCDAILIGAATLKVYRKPNLVSGVKKQPINVILSSTLAGVSLDWEFFRSSKVHRILFVGSKTPMSRIKRFSLSS